MINLNHLKYFFDVCRYESFSQSAKKNLISHSAISQAIKGLEQYYEVTLLVHKKNHFELTEQGKALYQEASNIFDSVEKSRRMIQEVDKSVRGDLKIASSQSMGGSFLPHLVKNYKTKYPLVLPQIQFENSKKLADLLLSKKAELGFAINDGQFSLLESRPYLKGKFILISNHKKINWEKETFLIGDKGDEVDQFKLCCKKHHFSQSVIEISGWNVIAKMVQLGLGVGLVPDFLLQFEKESKFHIVENPAIELPKYDLRIYFNKQEKLSRNARLFLETLA